MTRLIWWIRRDLRLEDNTALTAALKNADEVIPVFVLDKRLLASPRLQGPRIAWMLDGLRALEATLRRYGSSLIIRRGDPIHELLMLCQVTGAHGVYFNRDYSHYATTRDEAVIHMLTSAGIQVRTFKDLVIHEASEIVSAQGRPYEIYTPFRKAWLALPKPEVFGREKRFDHLTIAPPIEGQPIPSADDLNSIPVTSPIVPAGEHHALQRLKAFIAGPIFDYVEQRNRPDINGSAILSPYLRWGMVSPRQCYWAAARRWKLRQMTHGGSTYRPGSANWSGVSFSTNSSLTTPRQ